jgi:HlyD family secretion protein
MKNSIKIDIMQVQKKKMASIIILAILIFALAMTFLNMKVKGGYLGEVEGMMYTHASEVSGKILSCPIQLGSNVKKGDIIAVIDSTNQQYAVEQLELNLQKAKLAFGNTTVGQGGTADNNYSAARAVYNSAQTAANQARKDYQNAQSLYDGAAIPKEMLDSAKVNYETAVSTMESAKAKLDNIMDKTASSTANLDIAILESQLAQQQENLNKYTIVAICEGTIMSLNYKEGDMVQSGYNIADVSASAEKYVVFYYPKERLDQLTYEQEVQIYIGEDSSDKTESIKGILKFIDVKAQYTPKDLQTKANKNMESVKIKALLPSDSSINPGQVVRVSI